MPSNEAQPNAKVPNVGICKEKLTRKQATHLLALVEQWTRATVMSRSPAVGFPEYGHYFKVKLDLENKIRRYVFDTDNIVELGHKLGLPVDPKPERPTMKRKRSKHAVPTLRQAHKPKRRACRKKRRKLR